MSNLEPEPPQILKHIKWILLYGKNNKRYILLAIVVIITLYFLPIYVNNYLDGSKKNFNKQSDNNNYIMVDETMTTNEDPSKFPTLAVSNKLGYSWDKNVTIKAGDTLFFDIHYYGWHKGIKNLIINIDDLRNKIYYKGDTITVKAIVKASNLLPSKGKVKVHFEDNVKLKLIDMFWTKNTKETDNKIPFTENPANIFTNGLHLDDVPIKNDKDFYGNIMLIYKAVSFEE